MTVWLTKNMTPNNNFVFDDQNMNVVIWGNLNSDYDITFKVNNLVVFGDIITKKNISVHARQEFFNSGSMKGDKVSINASNICNSFNDKAIERVRALGIDVKLSPTGELSVNLPFC